LQQTAKGKQGNKFPGRSKIFHYHEVNWLVDKIAIAGYCLLIKSY